MAQKRYSFFSKIRKKFSPFFLLVVIFTILFVVFFGFPYYWQIVCSLKTPEDFSGFPPKLFPKPLYLERYAHILFKTHIPMTVKNSLIVSTSAMLLCLFAAIFSSYALAKLKIRGSTIILISVMVISMLPHISQIGPLYLVYKKLHLTNTRLGLILAYGSLFMPFAMWFLTSFFREVPDELEDAAAVDGCNVLEIIFRIIIPVAIPAIFTLGLMVFIFTWNEFMFAFILTTTFDITTYPVGILMLNPEHEIPWGNLTTASTIVSLPIIVVVVIAQKYVIRGITAGAVKG